MRLVSLVPAATEWIAAFGAADVLVGRSHACDHPPEALAVPALTAPRIDPSLDGAALDAAVRERIASGDALFSLDAERLRALHPTHVVVQDQCGVCAVAPDALAEALDGRGAALITWRPMTFKQVVEEALELGRVLGRFREAMAVIGSQERRIAELRTRLGARRDGTLEGRTAPAAALVEWVEPLMTAGHWAPDLIHLAGGRPVGSERGEPSRYAPREALAEADVLVVAACGRTVEQARADLAVADWAHLPAVRAGRVFVMDGDAYVNRPGPRLYRSVELLAAALHPDRAGIAYEPWELAPLAEVPA